MGRETVLRTYSGDPAVRHCIATPATHNCFVNTSVYTCPGISFISAEASGGLLWTIGWWTFCAGRARAHLINNGKESLQQQSRSKPEACTSPTPAVRICKSGLADQGAPRQACDAPPVGHRAAASRRPSSGRSLAHEGKCCQSGGVSSATSTAPSASTSENNSSTTGPVNFAEAILSPKPVTAENSEA